MHACKRTNTQVWVDGHKRARGDSAYLSLWMPIPPAGYVAMGALASTGGREPPSLTHVRTVHGDVYIAHTLLLSACQRAPTLWPAAYPYAYKQQVHACCAPKKLAE